MKRYIVEVPIVAVCCVDVEAESEKEAIDLAFKSDKLNLENVEEWEAHRIIAEGNYLHTYHNRAEVIHEEEIEESEG